MTVLAVALGGAVGALARWGLSRANTDWPRGTFAANMLGCLALGAVVGSGLDGLLGAALGTGLLGGLTTFSTFAVEVTDHSRPRWGYLAGTVAGGVVMAALGLALA